MNFSKIIRSTGKRFAIRGRKYNNSKVKHDLGRSIKEAEKLVSTVPTFDFDQLKMVAATRDIILDPIFERIKNDDDDFNIRLVILLLSKAIGLSSDVDYSKEDVVDGMLEKQILLANTSDIVHMSVNIHKTMFNFLPAKKVEKGLVKQNKLTILLGDFLAAKFLDFLVEMRNPDVMTIMNDAYKQMSSVEFIGIRDSQNIPLPSKYVQAKYDWTMRNTMSTGNLLGAACEGVVRLASGSETKQVEGFSFGKNLALAWNAYLDQKPFLNQTQERFSLVSAPVLFHLERDPNLYCEIEKGKHDVINVNYNRIRSAVLSGTGLKRTQQLLEEHSEQALKFLRKLPESEASKALTRIVLSMNQIR